MIVYVDKPSDILDAQALRRAYTKQFGCYFLF